MSVYTLFETGGGTYYTVASRGYIWSDESTRLSHVNQIDVLSSSISLTPNATNIIFVYC